ncbi:hypothetical protein ACE1AT_10045 [Pelatocladus sp. BLCC-F211]|uniref:hypothetical protein n=1 Tax=Pelatocladus sp. BLCC-F211 TaxID=3342752 RepID=UPI0035B724CB
MEILKIWDIIWDNTLFHYATAIVLIFAICVELYSVFRYCLKFRTTQTAINILEQWRLKGKNSNPKEDIRDWLKKHLGTYELDKIQRRNNKYFLITYPAILSSPVPRSSLRFVTTLCTAIGVLGTFYGIQQGLQDVNFDTRSIEQLMPAIKQLIAGMKTAFSTSLMGLGSGSIFTLILFATDSIKQNQRDGLREKLDEITTQEIAADQEANSLQAVVNNLNRVAKNLSGLQPPSAELIGEAIGQQIRTILLPGLRAIHQEQRQTRELQENQGQRVLENLIQDLRIQVLEPIVVRLDKSADLTEKASESVLTLHRDLGTSITTIQNFQQQTLTQLKEFTNDLSHTLSQFQTETRGVLGQTAVEINRAVNQSIEGMTAQRAAFQESAENAAATFRGIREELEEALRHRAEVEQEMLQVTRTGMINILSQAHTAFREQNSVLETTGNQASSLMNGARDNLLDTLGNIDHTLSACNQTVQQGLTSFREEYQAHLHNFFEQTAVEINRALDHSIEGMTAQRTAFQESAENAAATFRGIREELEQALQQRAEVEQQMLQATRTGMINILSQAHRSFQQELQTTGNEASSLMNRAKENLLVTLGNIDHKLIACHHTIEENLTAFREQYQANLHNFFEEQNNLLEETLGEQRDGLSGVVNHLNNVFKEEYQRRRELSDQFQKDMNLVSDTTQEVSKLANTVGINSNQRLLQLQEIAREIGTQVKDIQSQYRELSESFESSLNAWKNHFEQTQTHFFKEADTALAQVCQNLYHSADVLVRATDHRNQFNGNH